jgi:Big-like domain-containing protein/leishmanolysin
MRPGPRSSALPGALLLLAALAAACGGGPGTEPITPSAVNLSTSSVSFTAVGQTQQLSATVVDQDGATIASPTIAWSSSDAAVASVSATGLVTAVGAGSTSITATAGAVSTQATVTVVQTPAQLQKVSGDSQSAILGQLLAQPLKTRVIDAGGTPVAGVTVTFSSPADAGTFSAASVVTGSDGLASTAFRPLISGTIQVAAEVQGTALTASFTATGVSPFAIELRFLVTTTAARMQAFTSARQRWQSLIVGDLPDVPLDAPAGTCGTGSPGIQRVVDDVLILVTIEAIDGAGGVLGVAAPCYIRSAGNITAMGRMRLDSDDLAFLESAGLLEQVILHEMAHVLGFGTLWPLDGLLADASQGGGTDPHFTGPLAIAAFNGVGGSGYVGGFKVPVENTGGAGTADSHWRESVFGSELMTGFVQQGFNPLSRVSVASMADIGYVVNQAGADPYTLGAALRALGAGRPLELHNDVVRQPMRVVNEAGRVLRIVEP